MTEGNTPDSPTLADQVSKLYNLVAGYHVTHLVEIARELGVWATLTQNPGRTSSELAEALGTGGFLHRCPLPHRLLLRAPES